MNTDKYHDDDDNERKLTPTSLNEYIRTSTPSSFNQAFE